MTRRLQDHRLFYSIPCRKPVVPGQRKLKKSVLPLRPLTYVMHNPRDLATIRRWHHNGDVR